MRAWYLSQLQLIAVISYVSLAIYVLSRNPGSRINRSLTVFIGCLALWSLEQLLCAMPFTTDDALWLYSIIGSVGWISMSPAFLWFVQNLTGHAKSKKGRWWLAIALATGVVLFIAHCHKLLFTGFSRMPYGWTNTWADNYWAKAFFVYYLACVFTGLKILFDYVRQPHDVPNKRDAGRLMIFTIIGLGFGTISDIMAPILGLSYVIPPLGNVFCLIWALALGYSIARHRFLTISPATAAENIIRTMSDLLILTDTDGKIVRVNRAVEKCLDWRQLTLEGCYIKDLFVGDELPGDRDLEVVENRRVALKTRSGRILPAILSSSRLMDEGQFVGNVIVIKDISHLQLAEKALKISEARFRELVETINEVVFSLDAGEKVTYISPGFEGLTGHKIKDVLGRAGSDFIHPDDRNALHHQRKQFSQGQNSIFRYRLLNKNDGYRWVQVSAKPIMVDGRVMGINGILTDITDQVKAQEEKEALMSRLARAEKMEAIGTLAGAVAHDLNNVLSGLVTYPELMMLKLPLNSDLRNMAQTIMNSGVKAAAIVEDLLTLARRGVVTTELVDLNHIVREYLGSPACQSLKARHPRVQVIVDLAEGLDTISGSPVHLGKTLMNLMSNAFEAMPVNGGQIFIKTENGLLVQPAEHGSPPLPQGPSVILKVRDTGQGIAREDQNRIFEPFFTRKVMGRSGTGLGMAVVWGAVQDHGGHIELQSEPGVGTEFSLYFPAIKGKVAPAKEPVGLAMYNGSGETILLVDDEPNQRKIGSDILRRMGYAVSDVSSGEGAVEFLKRRPVDLVVLDMVLHGGMDGLDTYREIVKIRPEQRVIIASGYSKSERIQIALRSGVLASLKKPYLIGELGAAVRGALMGGGDTAAADRSASTVTSVEWNPSNQGCR